MIKHLLVSGKQCLLSIYNNALLFGCVLEDWRVGEVVFVLKKNPSTNIEYYCLITLISCVSKLMTRILDFCISSAVESSCILGLEQQGFRQDCHCKDNFFLHNSLLLDQESKQLVLHLMFMGFKEAYD